MNGIITCPKQHLLYCIYGKQERLKIRGWLNSSIRNPAFRNLGAVYFIEALCYFGIEKVRAQRKGLD